MNVRPQNAIRGRIRKLGITGYGRLAREYYLPALTRMRDVRVVAVADPLEESRLAAVKWSPLARVYLSHKQMM